MSELLTMHVKRNTVGGQLDEYLLFWQPAISIILYFALFIVLLFEMQIKYDDEDDMQLETTDNCSSLSTFSVLERL